MEFLKEIHISPIVLQTCSIIMLIYVLKVLWSRRKYYILSMKLPGPFAFPIVGNALGSQILIDFTKILDKLFAMSINYGGLFRLWIGPRLCVVITDPNDLEAILTSKEAAFKGFVYDKMAQIIGQGLVAISGTKYKKHRDIINPSFTVTVCKTYQHIHDKHARNLADELLKLKETESIDISINCLRFIADIIRESLIGDKVEYYKGNHDDIFKISKRIGILLTERLLKIWLLNDTFYYNFTKSGKNMAKDIKMLRSIHGATVNKMIDEYFVEKSNNTEGLISKKLLQIMADSLQAGDLTREDILNEYMNILSAGLDTTEAQLQFFLLMMGMHKRCQDLVWQEIKEVFADDLEAPVTSEHISKMSYLSMCLKEVARLFPTAPIQMRVLKKSFYLKNRNLILPAGINLIISNFVVHRNPKYWDDPDLFIPERFSPELSANRHRFTYIPFSAGPRNCIGKIMALDVLKTACIHLLRKMEFYSDLKMENLRLHMNISVKSENGYDFKIRQRHID